MIRRRGVRCSIWVFGLCVVVVTSTAWLPVASSAQYLTSRDVLAREPVPADFVISYGSDPNQFGHLRIPDEGGPHPVVVLLHGGCWRTMADLEYLGSMAADLTASGVATWSLEYRRVDSPGGGWPATFVDVGMGVDHLWGMASAHDLDLGRVVVAGHSSGGHLALWVAARSRIPESSPLWVKDPLPMVGAVSIAGPGALVPFREVDERVCGGDVIDDLLGGSPEDVPSRYEAGVPRQMLPLGVPQRMVTGASDGIVPPRFAEAYAEAAREAGDDAEAIVLEDAAHFEPVVPDTGAWPAVRRTILELLDAEGSADPATSSQGSREATVDGAWPWPEALDAVENIDASPYRAYRIELKRR